MAILALRVTSARVPLYICSQLALATSTVHLSSNAGISIGSNCSIA